MFLGFPVFFGAALGAAEALVLRRYLPGIGAAWVAASFFGWVTGSALQVFFHEIFTANGSPGGGLLVESLPWVSLGIGQAAALLWIRPRSKVPVALWVLAGAAGGVFTEAAAVLTAGFFYDALEGVLGEFEIAAAQLAVLAAILYAIPTGAVLVGILLRVEAGGTRDRERVEGRRQPGPSHRRRGVAVSVGLLSLLMLGAFGTWGLTNVLGCESTEREIFARFPQPGGRAPELESNLEGGLCFARFVTRTPRDEVYAYYGEKLRQRGWKVRVRDNLVATKGDDRSYLVRYEDYEVPTGHPVTVFVSG